MFNVLVYLMLHFYNRIRHLVSAVAAEEHSGDHGINFSYGTLKISYCKTPHGKRNALTICTIN